MRAGWWRSIPRFFCVLVALCGLSACGQGPELLRVVVHTPQQFLGELPGGIVRLVDPRAVNGVVVADHFREVRAADRPGKHGSEACRRASALIDDGVVPATIPDGPIGDLGIGESVGRVGAVECEIGTI